MNSGEQSRPKGAQQPIEPTAARVVSVPGLGVEAQLVVPRRAVGRVVVLSDSGKSGKGDVSTALSDLHRSGLATLELPLWRHRAGGPGAGEAADMAAQAIDWLNRSVAGADLPIGALGSGVGAAAALRVAASGHVESVVTWNGRLDLAYRQLSAVDAPTLMLLGSDASQYQRWMHRMARRRLRGTGELREVPAVLPPTGAYASEWLLQGRRRGKLSRPQARALRMGRIPRLAAAGALAMAMGLPAAGSGGVPGAHAAGQDPVVRVMHQSLPSSSVNLARGEMSARPTPHDPFADGLVLGSGDVHGDGVGSRRAEQSVRLRPSTSGAEDFLVLRAGDVRGDALPDNPFSVVQATGSIALIDNGGMKYFVNDNITFATSSSASAAMSEASFTHSVNATTLNGGTVASTLNDSFDGYNTLCVVNNNTVATCATGNANFDIYNQNGAPATLDASCNNRQAVFPSKAIGSLSVSRKVFVPDNDHFARWLNYFTNTGGSPQTVTAVIANNLGSDSNTTLVSTDAGAAVSPVTATTTDWVTTFQNYSGTTSSDPRLMHVLQGPGASVPLAGINFANGDDNPFWGYTFTLQPGETGIIMNFSGGYASKAEAAAKAAAVAALPPSTLACMTPTEIGQVLNFAPIDLTITQTASPNPVVVGRDVTFTLNVGNDGAQAGQNVTVTNTLPPGSTFKSASGTGWTCNEASLVVTCTRPSLAPGAGPPITILAAAPDEPGDVDNDATIESDVENDSSDNDSDDVLTVGLGVVAAPVSGLSTSERPTQVSFRVSLGVAPTTSVTIDVSTTDTGEGTVSPATLTFTPDNYATPQRVKVRGVDDGLLDGDEAYDLAFDADASGDDNYDGLTSSVSLTNKDDEYAKGKCRGTLATPVKRIGQTFIGTPGDDVIVATNRADVIQGRGGDDLICARYGDDKADGGAGNDVLAGGFGNDELRGGDGVDKIAGGPGSDKLFGGDGNDQLWGRTGDDELHGEVGNDRLGGGDGADRLFGDDGDDSLRGGRGEDILRGGADNDNLGGGRDADQLFGEDGDDNLRGGEDGPDSCNGGTGTDTLLPQAGCETVTAIP